MIKQNLKTYATKKEHIKCHKQETEREGEQHN